MLRLRACTVRGLAPFDVDRAGGECVAVIGPSGSGKSLIPRSRLQAAFRRIGRSTHKRQLRRGSTSNLTAIPSTASDAAG